MGILECFPFSDMRRDTVRKTPGRVARVGPGLMQTDCVDKQEGRGKDETEEELNTV